MPNNDNIIAQIATMPLTRALADPPPLDDVRLSAWLWELRRTVESNSFSVEHSLNALKTAVTETTAAITATSYSVTDDDFLILADATGGAITLNLPPAALVLYHVFIIKRLNSGVNSVTIDGDGAETIDGALTFVLSNQYDSINIISDGTAYWIF